MTTFTLQDLNIPTTADQAVETVTKEKWMEYGMSHPISQSAIDYATQHAPEPQPMPLLCESTQSEIDPMKLIDEMMSQFSIKLKLLATVINQAKAQPNTTPPEGNQSLQDCVSETLKQAGWFEDLVREAVNDMEFSDMIKDAVETDVEHYFAYSFDPTDHFDIDDAVANVVDDKLEDIVAEKFSNINISFN